MTEKPEHDPVVYLMRQSGKKVGVCLSTVGKWAAAIVSALIISAISTSAWLLYTTSQGVLELQTKVDNLDGKLDDNIGEIEGRLDRYNSRLGSVEKSLSGKSDK